MRKAGIFLLIIFLLSLIPSALATDYVITINDYNRHKQLFQNQAGTRNYSFLLNPSIFNQTVNITPGSPSNDSKAPWKAYIRSQIIESTDLGATNHYSISVLYNNTSMRFDVQWVKTLGFIWNPTYQFYMNDTLTCSNNDVAWYKIRTQYGFHLSPPNPWLVFDYNLHGKFGSNPSLNVAFGDELLGDVTCSGFGQPLSFGIEMQELTTYPIVVIQTFNSQVYSDSIDAEFATQAVAKQQQAAFLNATGGNECPWNLLGFCLDPLGILFTGFGFIGSALSHALTLIPFGTDLFNIITIPVKEIGDAFLLLASIWLYSDNNLYPGSVFWMHVIYSMTLGCIMAAFTGNPLTIVSYPFLFIRGIVKLTIFTVVGFFKLSVLLWDYGIRALQALIQAIRG